MDHLSDPQSAIHASRNTASGHVPALDGLRGMAILMVLLWHYVGSSQSIFPGWAGVDLFFVLSGFLITWRLRATRHRPNYLTTFYRNRALRVLPVYYTVVSCFFLALHLLVKPQHLSTFDTYVLHIPSFLIFTQNWTFVRFPLPKDLSLGPLWSIAVEVQLYIVWPFLLRLTRNMKYRIRTFLVLFVLVLLARCLVYLGFPRTGDSFYYNTFFRMDSFLAGSLVYLWHESLLKIDVNKVRASMAILLTLLIAGGLFTRNLSPYSPFFTTVGYSITAAFFACILHLAVSGRRVPAFLDGKLLRYFGKISYCLYIIHFPILQVVASRFRRLGSDWWPDHNDFFRWTAIAFSLLLSLLLSTLSYRYFESYFLRLKK